MEPVLEVTGLFQHVAGHCALSDISFSVSRGDWLLIVGPNGAGKSLLTRLILGLDVPSAGSLRLFGRDLGTLDEQALGRLRRDLIGAVLQGGALLEELTVLENLLLPLRSRPASRDEMARAARLVMTQLRLDGLENHLPRSLSLGQRRRVELGRALINKPALLVWDGLTDGLDLPGARDILTLLRMQQEIRSLTLVATDNRADLPLRDGDRVAVIDRGVLLFEGSATALKTEAERRLDLRHVLGNAA
jgi:ABC-type multidrug transport system ATPase subunit